MKKNFKISKTNKFFELKNELEIYAGVGGKSSCAGKKEVIWQFPCLNLREKRSEMDTEKYLHFLTHLSEIQRNSDKLYHLKFNKNNNILIQK